MLGYVQARNRFDASRNIKFKTFAEYRIKGAVLDEVRKMIGDERCKTPKPIRDDGFVIESQSDNGMTMNHADSQMDLDRFFVESCLSEREVEILRCRIAGMNLKEIAKKFEFSESRASQLLAKIKREVYIWYRDQVGMEMKLVAVVCPSCKTENCVDETSHAFRCECCDSKIHLKGDAPLLADESVESQPDFEQEETYASFA